MGKPLPFPQKSPLSLKRVRSAHIRKGGDGKESTILPDLSQPMLVLALGTTTPSQSWVCSRVLAGSQ